MSQIVGSRLPGIREKVILGRSNCQCLVPSSFGNDKGILEADGRDQRRLSQWSSHQWVSPTASSKLQVPALILCSDLPQWLAETWKFKSNKHFPLQLGFGQCFIAATERKLENVPIWQQQVLGCWAESHTLPSLVREFHLCCCVLRTSCLHAQRLELSEGDWGSLSGRGVSEPQSAETAQAALEETRGYFFPEDPVGEGSLNQG